MKKIFLILIMSIGILNATDVAICKFKGGSLSAYADDKILCSGAFDKTSTIQEMYIQGWKYKGSYSFKDEVYIVMEKETNK